MDEQENKTRGRSKDERSLPNHIPLDLAMDIVSRLPVKSIMRYQCVSKLWSSFITLPSFTNSFTSRSTPRSPTLLVTISSGSGKFVFSFPQHKIPDGSTYTPVYSYQIPNAYWCFSVSESVHGLILLPQLKIWNPTSWLTPNGWSSYLGYDSLEGKHKILCVLSEEYSDQPQVLTLGAHESWRIVTKERCPMHRPTRGRGRCFNGVLYYEATVDDKYILMSFDVKAEKFNIIRLPEYYHLGWSRNVIPYEGRLALVAHSFPQDHEDVVEFYTLKDAHGHDWTRQCFVLHVRWESERKYSLQFKGVTDAGELMFAPYFFLEGSDILYFDPRKNSTRKVRFEGIMGGEFGLASGYPMEVFPYHMESLFSL